MEKSQFRLEWPIWVCANMGVPIWVSANMSGQYGRVLANRSNRLLLSLSPVAGTGQEPIRVAKCHRYGRLICVNFLEVWGKILKCNIRASDVCENSQFGGVILPQTHVNLAQILNSIFQWGDFNPGTFTFNPNSMKISNWTTNVANQTNNDLD